MDSIWTDGVTLPAFPTLQEDIQTDAAVIGGGTVSYTHLTFLDVYSIENYMFSADSPERKWIIETAHAEKAR